MHFSKFIEGESQNFTVFRNEFNNFSKSAKSANNWSIWFLQTLQSLALLECERISIKSTDHFFHLVLFITCHYHCLHLPLEIFPKTIQYVPSQVTKLNH